MPMFDRICLLESVGWREEGQREDGAITHSSTLGRFSSANLWPSVSLMYLRAWCATRSGHQVRIKRRRSKVERSAS